MLAQLRLISEALPWTIPAVLGGGVLGLLTMFLGRRRSRSDRVGLALFVWCLVIAFTVTLSPVRNTYFGVPSVGCNLDVWKPLARSYWFSSGSRPPNIWLFLPAGLGAMLLDGFFRRFFALSLLVALPPGIEFIQDRYPQLKRSCSSQDIVDNWTGLAMGLCAGAALMVVIGLARLLRRRARRRSEQRAAAGIGRDREFTTGPLPLHGGPVGGYSDFADFDDSPNSTRWWAESDRDAPTVTRAVPRSGAENPLPPERHTDDTPVLPLRISSQDGRAPKS